MTQTATVKVTLQHLSGAVSGYRPGTGNNAATHGALKEAVVTVVGTNGTAGRVELLRSDIPGADWVQIDRAKAYLEFQARLQQAALDLSDGHDPHIVVTLGEGRELTNARLETNAATVARELQDSSKRAMTVPRLLPYQLGGTADGATAVIFSPQAGGGLRVHSLHCTSDEARLALEHLKSQGETKTGLLQVHTTVTALIAAAARGEYTAPARVEPEMEHRAGTAPSLRANPALMPSPFSAPTPFNS